MEWLVLILLVPAIVVPIVLLWGFVGCSFEGAGVPSPPTAPVLTATPMINAIKLDWMISEMALMIFEIHRAKDFGPFELLATVTSPTLAFVDPTGVAGQTPLQAGITYRYKIFASFETDAENRSPESNIVDARPLAFAATLTVDQPDFQGNCLIQRITSAQLRNSGTTVKLTVRGSTTGSLTLDRIYLSQPATAGNAYDALPAGVPGGLTKIIDVDAGDPPVTIAASAATTLTVTFELAVGQDLLVAFDINAAAGQGNIGFALVQGAEFYFRPGTQQAAVADRIPNPGNLVDALNTAQGRNYLVEKIEVL